MVFQHYGLRASKQEYGKYDHILYIDIVPEKPRTSDETRQNAYDVKKDVAVRVMKDIEEYLVTSGLAVEIQVEEVPADKTRPEIGAPERPKKAGKRNLRNCLSPQHLRERLSILSRQLFLPYAPSCKLIRMPPVRSGGKKATLL